MTPSTVARTRQGRTATKRPLRGRAKAIAKTVIVTVSASKAREEFSNWVSVVSYGHKWVVLKRHGKPSVAMVPVADLEVLRDLEDRIDLEAAREALSEPGETSWEEVKAKLGL